MSGRPCAKCKSSSLTTTQVPVGAPDGVDVDICGSCKGVWLDWGELGDLKELRELRRLIPSMTGSAAWQRDLQDGRCPACEERPTLARLDVGAFGIDRCPGCLGLWFDGGELGPMLTEQGFQSLLKVLRDNPI